MFDGIFDIDYKRMYKMLSPYDLQFKAQDDLQKMNKSNNWPYGKTKKLFIDFFKEMIWDKLCSYYYYSSPNHEDRTRIANRYKKVTCDKQVKKVLTDKFHNIEDHDDNYVLLELIFGQFGIKLYSNKTEYTTKYIKFVDDLIVYAKEYISTL